METGVDHIPPYHLLGHKEGKLRIHVCLLLYEQRTQEARWGAGSSGWPGRWGGGEQLASGGMEGRVVREILTVHLFLRFLVLEPRKHFSYLKN